MWFIIKLLIIIYLSEFVFSEQFLFKYGRITVRNLTSTKRTKIQLNLKNVQYIDNNLINTNTESIKLNTKTIKNLYEQSISNLNGLKMLRLSYCGIEALSPGAFHNLPKLSILHLQSNYIEVIEEGVFNNLPIISLYLHGNYIKTIRSRAFDNMPNLKSIKLNSNKLTIWDSNWFYNTPKLSELFFRRNQIKELPAKAFHNLKTSHTENGEELVDLIIYLSKNQISFIDPEAFKGIDSLYQLWLDRNLIRELHSNTFSHLTELRALHLKKNNLNEFDKNLFQNLKDMDTLDISYNHFQCLPYEIVSIIKSVHLDANNVDCNCLFNLRDRLNEERKPTTIIDDDECRKDFI